MNSCLIPERPILVYPSLAATLGLEESILLSVLTELASQLQAQLNRGFAWYTISTGQVQKALPFWGDQDIARICKNLHAKGVLLIGASEFARAPEFRFSFNEKVLSGTSTSTGTPAAAVKTPAAGLNYIAANWQPDRNTLAQLAQHNIPDNFCYEQVPEFVTYWRERGEAQRSWGAKFIQHVIRQWRQYEAQRNRQEQNSPIHDNWWPSVDALEVLTVHASIPKEFVEDAVPEFILYWKERGDALKTWNSKFIQHVRIQWKKYTSALENSTDPKPIAAQWQPSEDVYDVLRLANIDLQFAHGLIPEFVLYWRDSGQVHTSWNTRFLQHAKREWAKRHSLSSNSTEQRSLRDIPLEEKLNDRSWAV